MQLTLIIGIGFAIGAVFFALQNNVDVMVTVAFWHFQGSLAVVLLLALGLGVLIAGLLSSATVIRRQWTVARLRRQVVELEHEVSQQERRNSEFAIELARLAPDTRIAEPEPEKPYVGLRALFAEEDEKPLTGTPHTDIGKAG